MVAVHVLILGGWGLGLGLALLEIGKMAISKKTGARGLRSILEKMLLDVMYEIPSQDNIREVIIHEEVVT